MSTHFWRRGSPATGNGNMSGHSYECGIGSFISVQSRRFGEANRKYAPPPERTSTHRLVGSCQKTLGSRSGWRSTGFCAYFVQVRPLSRLYERQVLKLSLPLQKATMGGVVGSGDRPEVLRWSITAPPDWTPVPNRSSSQKAGWSSVQWTRSVLTA